jgi:sec-independent protein translocase protein TatC
MLVSASLPIRGQCGSETPSDIGYVHPVPSQGVSSMAVLPTHDHETDVFAATRMPLGDHIEDLRRHLFRAVAGLGIALTLVFVLDFIGYITGTPVGVAKPVADLIKQPVEQELLRFHDRRLRHIAEQLREELRLAQEPKQPQEVSLEIAATDLVRAVAPILGTKVRTPPTTRAGEPYVPVRVRVRPLEWTLALAEAQQRLGPRPTLATLAASEAMMVYFKVALVCGFVLSSPWVFWQLWSFVAAGLYAHEKRPLYLYLPFSLGLFIGGVAFCQLLVIPPAVEAMLGFNEWLDLEPALRLSEWLGFAIFLPLLFGLSFQTPLVMLLAHRLGLVAARTYRDKRRLAWFLLAMFAAVASPGNDLLGMLLLWLPLCGLYELGVVLCRRSDQYRIRAVDEAEKEELVEV